MSEARLPDPGELAGLLDPVLDGGLGGLEVLAELPLADRSTHALHELLVRRSDGSTLRVVLKDFGRRGFDSLATLERPEFACDPLREIEVYREVLAPYGLGAPELLGALVEPELDRYWLLLRFVEGTPLWQRGDLEAWLRTARWLAAMHDRLSGARGLPGRLLRYDGRLYRRWFARALRFHRRRTGAPRAARLSDRIGGAVEESISLLDSLPATFLHGEIYPSNVLVESDVAAPLAAEGGDAAIRPLDWEMAGVGPAALDVAALVAGRWSAAERDAIAEAYRDALPAVRRPSRADWRRQLEGFRLLIAVQWLGWAWRWRAPQHQVNDWVEEALAAAASVEAGATGRAMS